MQPRTLGCTSITQWASRPRAFKRHLASTVDLSKIGDELKARRIPTLYDRITGKPSYLLTQTLKDFLPFEETKETGAFHFRGTLPPGHHLVYFQTPTTASELLPDGTDTLHYPGPPFTRRLWAGGQVVFNKRSGPFIKGASLSEHIQDVRVVGTPGAEKIFVTIDREVVGADTSDASLSKEADGSGQPSGLGKPSVVERRQLCFLRDDVPLISSSEKPRRILSPPADPSFVHPLTPTPSLLFRFSALTFNAHAIHLDPQYARHVYGLPNLVVHGPLCLILMLESVRKAPLAMSREFPAYRFITSITYRNLRPLFVGEEMRVCGKRRPFNPTATATSPHPDPDPSRRREDWDVWIETGSIDQPSIAVRAVVDAQLHPSVSRDRRYKTVGQ